MVSILKAGGPWQTRPIWDDEKHQTIGWIRRQTGGSRTSYMVKIYGAQWESNGVIKGAMTDCKIFSSLKEAKQFAVDHLGLDQRP